MKKKVTCKAGKKWHNTKCHFIDLFDLIQKENSKQDSG
jgi:hypothetical protein